MCRNVAGRYKKAKEKDMPKIKRCIKSKQGTIIKEKEKLLQRCNELFHDSRERKLKIHKLVGWCLNTDLYH